MDIATLPVSKIVPYARNPRKNTLAVATVKASLKEYGWQQPIVIDREYVAITLQRYFDHCGKTPTRL